MAPDDHPDAQPTDPTVPQWVGLACPVCDNTGFDGQGRDAEGRYIHRCPECNTTIHTPEHVWTAHPDDVANLRRGA